MEPESLSPYPQVLAACPYPEPTPSNPHDPFQLLENPSEYYPPIYVLVSTKVSFPQASPPTPCAHLYQLSLYYPKCESPVHFYLFSLQGDTLSTLSCSDWLDNEMAFTFRWLTNLTLR